jgi:hypothetical protein
MAMKVYSDDMVFDHIMRSNIPKSEKSTLRRWFDSVTGGKTSEVIERYGLDRAVEKKVTVGEVVVAGTEAMGIGGILGALHAVRENGLDVKVPFTNRSVPIDGSLSGLAYIAAVAVPVIGEHAKNVGTSAAAVYAFRKFHDMLAARRISKMGGEETVTTSSTPDAEEPAPADIGEDPIITLANKLDS